MLKTNLGKKIKSLRKKRGLTQAAIAGEKITRNMLSSIENGKATPSLETLFYIADALSVSVDYLLSDEKELLFYDKKSKINNIYRAFEAKNYTACINLIESLSGIDNEIAYLLCASHLELAKKNVAHGSLPAAEKHLAVAEEYSQKTKINTEYIDAKILMYKAITKNIQSPLLEFDAQKYTNILSTSVDFEFYKYLTLDASYTFETPTYSLHMEAKKLIQERNYSDAVKLLLNAAEVSKKESYNAFLIFGIYTDLEYCYKQLYDYEKAYLYSTKRMTLLEEFKA